MSAHPGPEQARLSRRSWFRQVWVESPGLHRGYIMDVLTAFTIGVLLIVGGRARTVAPAWGTLNDSGGPLLWGAVLIGLGVVLVAATFWRPAAVVAALCLLTMFYWLLALWFLRSAWPVETGASFIGAVLMARAGIMHLSRAWAYRERAEVEGTLHVKGVE